MGTERRAFMTIERRRAPRYQLVAEAEIISPLSEVCLGAQTSDLSLFGCFMNTNFSLPLGTEIRLRLKHEQITLITSGVVARSEPSMGFGVSFTNMKEAQKILLQRWLQELQAPKSVAHGPCQAIAPEAEGPALLLVPFTLRSERLKA
jgi:PilZ domain